MTEKTPRIPRLQRAEWDDRVRDVFSVFYGEEGWINGHPHHVLNTFGHHPPLAYTFLTFNRYLLKSTTLPPRLRQIAIMRVAWNNRVVYMWSSHLRMSLNIGMDAEDFEAVKEGAGADHWDTLEALLIRGTDELLTDKVLSDTLWDGLSEYFDRQQMLDFLFTVGTYDMLSLIMNTLSIEREAELQQLAEQYGCPER